MNGKSEDLPYIKSSKSLYGRLRTAKVLLNQDDLSSIMPKLMEIKKNTTNEDLSALADEVIDLKNKKTNTQQGV